MVSESRFRSWDLWVMSPTRFRCANSLEGLVPDKNFRMRNAQRERQKDTLIGVGFEPTPPKRLVPKTSALDRSAIQPMHPHKDTQQKKDLAAAAKGTSPTGTRTRVVWVKTTYPDQLDYWGWYAPAGNQTRVSSVAGTYTITVLPAH